MQYMLESQVLLDRNADANRLNRFGMSPLHHASVAANADIVRALIEVGGARAGGADDAGRAPLHFACAGAAVDVVRVLLEVWILI